MKTDMTVVSKKIQKFGYIQLIEYTIILEDKSKAKGFVQVQNNNTRITDLSVPADFRHKGYGTQLLKAILKDADARCSKVSGMPASYGSVEYKRNLIKYYETFGFVYDKHNDEVVRKPSCKRR